MVGEKVHVLTRTPKLYSRGETEALLEFVENGGSLLQLGNIYDYRKTLSGAILTLGTGIAGAISYKNT